MSRHRIGRVLRDPGDPESEALVCFNCGATAISVDRTPELLLLGKRFLEWKPLGSEHRWYSVEREPWWECDDGEVDTQP